MGNDGRPVFRGPMGGMPPTHMMHGGRPPMGPGMGRGPPFGGMDSGRGPPMGPMGGGMRPPFHGQGGPPSSSFQPPPPEVLAQMAAQAAGGRPPTHAADSVNRPPPPFPEPRHPSIPGPPQQPGPSQPPGGFFHQPGPFSAPPPLQEQGSSSPTGLSHPGGHVFPQNGNAPLMMTAQQEGGGGAPGGDVPEVSVIWEEHAAPDGTSYFFCPSTKVSAWVRPAGPGIGVVDKRNKSDPAGAGDPGEAQESSKEQPAETAPQQEQQQGVAGGGYEYESIGSTAWVRVRTAEGRVFFFNKETNKSVWKCPDEIKRIVALIDGKLLPPEESGSGLAGEGSALMQRPDQLPPGVDSSSYLEYSFDFRQGEGGESDLERQQQEQQQSESESDSDSSGSEKETAEQVEARKKLEREARKIAEFRKLLKEKGAYKLPTFEAALPKLLHDRRFQAFPPERRKALFSKYARVVAEEVRMEQSKSKKEGLEAFTSLLKEAEERRLLTGSTTERGLERDMGGDPRWDSVDPKTRQRLIEERARTLAEERERRRDRLRSDFREMVREGLETLMAKEKKRDRENKREPRAYDREKDFPDWDWMKTDLRDDERYKAVGSSSERENLYWKEVKAVCLKMQKEERDREREREGDRDRERDRDRDGKRGREDAVEEDDDDDWEKKKVKMARKEAERVFRLVLEERLKNPFEISFSDAMSIVSNDTRMETVLERSGGEDEMKEMFRRFVEESSQERQKDLSFLLDKNANADPNKSNDELIEVLGLKKLPRFKVVPRDILDSAFEAWRRKEADSLKAVYMEFLKTSPLIAAVVTSRGAHAVGSLDSASFEQLRHQIAVDVRYQKMEFLGGLRDEMLRHRVEAKVDELKKIRDSGLAERIKQL